MECDGDFSLSAVEYLSENFLGLSDELANFRNLVRALCTICSLIMKKYLSTG